ncbi:hypothetical protein N7462_004027 [Penicillium macrosclerotiorum]|uniref:uncharacterized protein n=1 Tax=Penicillium macrosclerotiorum TaxID=303699 RepID=UPI0025472DC3|nr:uncharacterized protein N7462_004027 [Penicillium macrosclerotiorum]KAJ5689635.1 hypothetical protein N7462_004027 [Penicillium macrosclerotiorum]
MLSFSLWNSHTFTFDPDGPFPALYRLLTVRSPSIHTLDLTEYAGKFILITGATQGCGLECARALGRVGCHLILTARDLQRGENIKQQIETEAKDLNVATVVDIIELDLKSLKSVNALPRRLEKIISHLDIAILNAGAYQTKFHICQETGWEEIFQVNFLANCNLMMLLRPFLARATRGRVIAVSSEAHAWADPSHASTKMLANQLSKSNSTSYPCYQRYHISKLLLNLWVRDISSREEWNSISVATVSPGFSRTALFRDFNNFRLARLLEKIVCRTSEQGASQYIFALWGLEAGNGNGGFWSDGNLQNPSMIVRSQISWELQSTIYADVMEILHATDAKSQGGGNTAVS